MTGLRKDDKVHTTLALVHTYPDGDRDFSFYRDPRADMMLTEEEIPEELILETRIFHFGTLSMTHENVRRATKKQLQLQNRLVRSFHLILIYVSHCGIQWMRQESRYCMVWDSVIS